MPPLFSKKTPTEPGAGSGLASFLRKDLELTRARWKDALGVLRAHPKIDEALYEELESQLLAADVGVAATASLIERLRKAQRDKRLEDSSQLEGELKSALVALLAPLEKPLPARPPKPYVILLAGVNGAGKTTTIAKLTRLFQSQGKSVLLAAGDTFRAAAREQLAEWGVRHNVTVVSQDKGDSAAVIFDAIQSARAKGDRRRARRHRGRLADAAAPDGGDPQGEARDGEGRRRRAPRDVARARRQHRAERGAPGEGLRRSARPHRASSSPSSTAPPRAARWRPSRASIRCRSASSASARSPGTCGPSSRPISSKRSSRDPVSPRSPSAIPAATRRCAA